MDGTAHTTAGTPGPSPFAIAASAALGEPDRWPHVMVDIETMSTHSSRAVILSIGVVPFELLAGGPRFSRDVLLLLPDIAEQLADGRIVDPKTQGWWRDQKPAARAHWLDPRFGGDAPDAPRPIRCPLREAAMQLNAFLEGETLPDAGLWANGAVFDIGNLENLMHGVGIQPGWRYNSVRDYRTVSKILPRIRDRQTAEGLHETFIAHDPVSDCRQQIWRLWEHAPAALMSDVRLTTDPESPLLDVLTTLGGGDISALPTHAVRPEPVQ